MKFRLSLELHVTHHKPNKHEPEADHQPGGVTTMPPPNTKTQNPEEPASQPDSASTPTKTVIIQITTTLKGSKE